MKIMVKECFGKIIKDSKKMVECKYCELGEECIAVNWGATYQSESLKEPEKETTDKESAGSD
jgi:hypothetical protein